MAKLYFYYSAMNAGKSATLLQSNHNYRSNGMHTALFTPRLDDRYGEGQITSRIGLQASALKFEPDFDFFAHLNPSPCGAIDRLCLDRRVPIYGSCPSASTHYGCGSIGHPSSLLWATHRFQR